MDKTDNTAQIKCFQIYGYSVFSPDMTINTDIWEKIGEVDLVPLPVSCTLAKEIIVYFGN